MNLFVDDLRDPSFLPTAYPKFGGARFTSLPSDFKIARTVREAKEMVEVYGYPDVLCMDNDLGEGEEEGYRFVDWILEKDIEEDWMTEDFIWIVHSMNPVGSMRMAKALDNHYKRKFWR